MPRRKTVLILRACGHHEAYYEPPSHGFSLMSFLVCHACRERLRPRTIAEKPPRKKGAKKDTV